MSSEDFQYERIERIGSGSDSETWLANAVSQYLGERWPVALKVLGQPYPESLRHEAQRLRDLRLRSVIGPSVEAALADLPGRPVLVMDYVPGVDLLQIARVLDERGESPPIRAMLQLGAALFKALSSLHELPGYPILHRSLTPADVRISIQGEVSVVDVAVHDGPSKKGLPFAAPEQRSHSSPPGDVYAASSVFLWALLAPDGPVDAQRRYLSSLMGPGPAEQRAAELLLAALERDPAARPEASALADALEQAARACSGADLSLFAPRIVSLSKPKEEPKRPRRASMLFGATELILALLAVLLPMLLVVVVVGTVLVGTVMRRTEPLELQEPQGGFRSPVPLSDPP